MEDDAMNAVHLCTLRGGVYGGPPPAFWQSAFGSPDHPVPEREGAGIPRQVHAQLHTLAGIWQIPRPSPVEASSNCRRIGNVNSV